MIPSLAGGETHAISSDNMCGDKQHIVQRERATEAAVGT